MKYTPSTSIHESFVPKISELVMYTNFETHVKNQEEDNIIVTQMSKNKALESLLVKLYIYLVDDTTKIIEVAYSSLHGGLWKEVV
jgi:hypothetical protein